MRLSIRTTAFVLFVLVCILTAGISMSDKITKWLRIRIPEGLDLEKVTVITGQYGNGLVLAKLDNKTGREFILLVHENTTKVKVLGYYPGYRLSTVEMPGRIPKTPIILDFKKLPTVPLTLKVVDSNGKPVRNFKVVIRQSLQEMPYFGYLDGMVFDYQAAPVASGTTDASGMLIARVPKLSEDPLFSTGKLPFSVMGGSKENKSVVLAFIPVQDTYKNPVVVKLKK